MTKRKRRLLIIVVALATGLGYLAYSLLAGSGADYLTVSELKAQGESSNEQHLTVEGRVASGSIDWDDKAKVMRFVLTDGRDSLNAVYEGVVPDDFKLGVDLVVVGKYRPDGVFEASNIGRRGSLCNTCHT